MNIQFYIEKLCDSDAFLKFQKENPDAFFCSGFFIIDKEGKDSKTHLDYFVPKGKKMTSFQLEDMKMVPMDIIEGKEPTEMPTDIDLEFGEVENLILDKMKEEGMKNKVQKIIFSLQNVNGEVSLIGTVFISMMGMIKIAINVQEMKITEFEKKSFFDIMKVTKSKD